MKQHLGAVGKHGSIAVTERVVQTLKREWLGRVPLVRGMEHLSGLFVDSELYCTCRRCRRRLGGATPPMINQGRDRQEPGRSARTVQVPLRLKGFSEQRITVYEPAA